LVEEPAAKMSLDAAIGTVSSIPNGSNEALVAGGWLSNRSGCTTILGGETTKLGVLVFFVESLAGSGEAVLVVVVESAKGSKGSALLDSNGSNTLSLIG